MKTPLITRQQLEIINRRTLRYPLQTAEKDYFLAVVMQIISTSPWGDALVFKGGTALNHCFLEQNRFSEDLDFSSNRARISLEDVRKIFEETPFLSVRKDYLSDATIKIEKLQYTGPLLRPNSLKVEIDILQNVLLPPVSMKYNNVWGLDFKVTVMDVREICAEKIRAMSDRARYRDFYDFFLLTEKHKPDLNEIVSYIARKEIRKPITKANILQNWIIVGTQKNEEMDQVYYSRKIDHAQIANMIEDLPLTEISRSEKSE
jgi:uncharacterized protein